MKTKKEERSKKVKKYIQIKIQIKQQKARLISLQPYKQIKMSLNYAIQDLLYKLAKLIGQLKNSRN